MAKKPAKKPAKKRAANYEKPLRINGSFLDVIKTAVGPDKKKKV